MYDLPRRPGRRPSLLWLLILPIGVVAAGIPRLLDSSAGTEPPDARPNVLIVITDDQRGDSTMTRRTMPNALRWFARGGTRYPKAYAATPLCCPSRASMMTGQLAHNHGVVGNLWPQVQELDHATTIQRYLHDAGYRTGIFGKFFNHWPLRRNPPHFDRWATFFRGYRDASFNVQGTVQRVNAYTTTFVGRRAAAFVRAAEEADDTPWLMYVSVFAPHGRATPEPRYADAPVGEWAGNPAVTESDRGDKPPYVQAIEPAPFSRYLARATAERRTLLSVDDVIADLSAVLRETGEERDTLAFLVGDNGKLWGEHGLEHKRVPYTPSVNVPLLARWPGGGLAAGGVDGRLVTTADIGATVLAAAGIEPAHLVDGRSLLDPSWRREHVLLEHWGAVDVPSWASIVTAREQYVEYYDGSSPEGTPTFREYYDTASDPWQLRNLLADEDDANDPDVSALVNAIARYAACRGTDGPSACP